MYRSSLQSPPFAGGLHISDRRHVCTSAFVARTALTREYRLLTAGHCGSTGGSWEQGEPFGFPIGTLAENAYRTGGEDGAAIRMSSLHRSDEVYVDGEGFRSMAFVDDADFVGEAVCKSGITSEKTCGAITSTNVTVPYADATLYNQREADLYSAPGDSGSPIFYLQKAMGILSGGPANDFTITNYSQITRVENALGARVVTR